MNTSACDASTMADHSPQLPSSQSFITSIIQELTHLDAVVDPALDAPQNSDGQYQSVFSLLPPDILAQVKPLVLTLHCLFPDELLLALDILDRKMISRYYVAGSDCNNDQVYLVNSSLSAAGKRNYNSGFIHDKSYVVCLNAWNCSCPAFATAMFGGVTEPELDKPHESASVQTSNTFNGGSNDFVRLGEWRFGGFAAEAANVPVCKHILASVLGSCCPSLFGRNLQYSGVDIHEFAALQAGFE